MNLADAKVVDPSDPTASTTWDLAFEGYDVFTNSGPSGSGKGAAFGQLEAFEFVYDGPPAVPFVSPDKAGGAFVGWYAYDGTTHALYSRYHVYGVKDGDKLWKAQVLSYYAEQDNAPVSALYEVRYAGTAGGETKELQIDGTAGGLAGAASAPSGCIDLDSGALLELTSDEARQSKAWDLCFRRDSISVNGEAGGPRGVAAVDLQADDTDSEMLADVEKETAEGALPAFDKISASSFAHSQFRGDHLVSAFETGKWVDTSGSPPKPASGIWLVVDASGQQQFLIAFSSFQNATTSSPGTVVMHIKPVNQ